MHLRISRDASFLVKWGIAFVIGVVIAVYVPGAWKAWGLFIVIPTILTAGALLWGYFIYKTVRLCGGDPTEDYMGFVIFISYVLFGLPLFLLLLKRLHVFGRHSIWSLLLLVLVFGPAAATSQEPPPQPAPYLAPQFTNDKRGTKESPVVVDIPRSTSNGVEGKLAKEKTDYSSPEWWLVYATGALALYTALLFSATVKLGKDAKASSATQVANMQASVAEAVRSADAMEDVAKATRNNAELMTGMLRKQFRAYVVVDTGNAQYQDQWIKFAGQPVLNNTGLSPARNLSYKTMAAILPADTPTDYEFSDDTEMHITDLSLAPRQTYSMNGVVPDRIPDDEVKGVMNGHPTRLWVWGKVEYDDIFGDHHETNFCQNYVFIRDNENKLRITGYYHFKHNNAT